jgi:hypothetical protein
MPAVILNHTAHEVKLRDPRDPVIAYPVTADTVAAAEVQQSIERLDAHYTPPTEEEWARLDAHEGLMNLIKKYGGPRVMRWVRNLAAINGESV